MLRVAAHSSNLSCTPGATAADAGVTGVSLHSSHGVTHVIGDLADCFLDPDNVPQPLGA